MGDRVNWLYICSLDPDTVYEGLSGSLLSRNITFAE